MKKAITYAIPLLLVSLVLSEASYANLPDPRGVAEECTETARQLNDLASSKPEDSCAGDLEIAAAYIEAAGFNLRFQKNQQALTSIKYGELELKEISMNRTYCAGFSQSVKPVRTRVIRLASEIGCLSKTRPQT